MKMTKRILAFVLCFAMLVGLMPMYALRADAAGTLVDAAIFCSDVHGNPSTVTSVFNGIKSADSSFNPSTASFVGDTQCAASSVTSAAQEVYSGVQCIYAFGNHDDEGDYGIDDFTGLSYGSSSTNYYIYTISENDMSTSSPDTSGFTSTVDGLDKTKPLFIISHMPLHARRDDNNGAAAWYDAISAAAESMDIFFFWAHNHTSESDVDTAAYYVAKNGSETISIQGGETVTPNFTYANAGYIDPPNTPARNNVATAVRIYDDSVNLTVYNSSGVLTGSYAVNETVTRQFANGSTEGGDSGDSGDTDTDTGTGDSTTSGTVYVLTDTLTTGKNYLIVDANAAGSGNVLVNSSGSVGNTTVTIKSGELTIDGTTATKTYIELSDSTAVWTAGTSSSSSDVTCFSNDAYNSTTYYLYHDSGALSLNTSTSKNNWTYESNVIKYTGGGTTYYLNYSDGWNVDSSASSANVYIYEETTVDVAVTLSSIAATCSKTYDVGDTFSAEDLVVTATYSDGSTSTVTPTSVTAPDMTTAGTKTVTVTYTEGEVTKTTTVDITVNEVISDTATLTGLEITAEPTTTDYNLGESLNTAGMVVTATYDDNGTVKTKVLDADAYTVSEVDMTTEGTKTVTVSYTFNGVTLTDTFDITVTEAPSNEVTLGGSVTTTKKVYVLTSSITSGTSYLIVNGNSAGSYYALANNSGSVAATGVTVVEDDTIGTYIELTDATDELWTVGSGYTFQNGSYYLGYTTSGNSWDQSYSFGLSTTARDWSYSTSNNRLSTSVGSWSTTTYYLRYNDGWTWTSQNNASGRSVYFYVLTEIEDTVDTTVKYTMRASDLKQVVDTTNTATLAGQIDFCLQGNGADLTTLPSGGSYAFTVLSDESGIISGDIASDGSFTFSGTTGTASVKVAYTWTADDGNSYTVYKNITIEASEPYYTIDLHKANVTYTEATGLTEFADGTVYYTQNEDGTYTQVADDAEFDSTATYYTLSFTLGDEITETIAIKGIEEGDKYGVWAVVTYYDGTTESGTDMGTVGSDIEWSSSDDTIASVDPNTGIITFTGKEGSVTITATYKNGNKPSDSVVISVTQSQYSVPSDGTNDFPEYPNEGAIRYDKTATAVGNFSETGIAMVELSMTGVPYTTGSEIDVVLMLDMTGSMTDDSMAAAEAAAKAFADQIIKNEDDTYNSNRISVQVFTTSGVTELWALSAVTADTYDSLITAIESASTKQASGGTPYSTALQECYEILYAAKSDGTGNNRSQYCVFVSDGTPTTVTYITDTTTPTTTTTVSFERNDATYTQTVPDYSTGSTASTFYGSTSYHEYWSQLMINNGVTVFGVYTSAAAGSTGSNGSGGSVNDTTEGTNAMTNVASSADNVYVVEDYTDTSAVEGALTSVAQKILQAATDVTVEDQITDEYTMIFDLPTGDKTITGLESQEFYIEFVKYTLDSNHERTDDVTSVTKLYLGVSNGTYYAASDSSGTAYAAPVFEQAVIGEKGTLYYWTTDDNYASKAAVTYTNSDDTYYFVPYGMEANEDGSAPESWYNMTSGAYANGTVDSTTNMSTDLVIATPYFVYNASTKMLYWTVDKLDTTEYALRYFLYLDNSATEVGTDKEVDAATYPTNDHAYITYTNFRGNDCQQKFPIPQLTWNGAQVSYVFYLVNAAGQPINKSGQVVDFANAVFVTDVYTKSVVWNKGVDGTTGTGELSADWLAEELLPDEYTIYDELAGFTLNVYEKADGTTIKNQFTIEGDTAANISTSLNDRLDLETTESTVSTVTTKVYNTKAGEKVTGYGTYYSTDTDMAGIDFSNVTVAFAVVWESKLVEDVVVVDFGLDVLINVVQNDLLQNTVSGIGYGNEAYGEIKMNTGVIGTSQLGTANLTIDGNTISIENENQIRFHQGDMEFTAPVKFYYESPVKFYEDSEQKTGYMYSSVTVIPATTIYYEDEYVELKTYEATKNEDGSYVTDDYGNPVFDTVGTAGWDTNSVAASATQQQDRPGVSQISKDLDADNNYGYDSAYEEMATHSMDNAAKINVNAYKKGEATFTFYGTGFDIISVTSNMTGTLMVQVTGTTASGASYRKNLMVDTYYGYTQNEDGEWVTSVNDPNALYQVPVIKLVGLEYGQYTVKLVAAYSDAFAHDTAGSYDLYLDAIRIYDPTGNKNTEANNAYVKDGEGWPIYKELRNLVIEAETFGSYLTVDSEGSSEVQVDGVVFIDSADTTYVIADYTSYGPNNELYLAPGQAVAFEIADVFVNSEGEAIVPVKVQLAIKTVGTSDAKVEIFNPSISTSTTTDGDTQTTTKTFVKGDLIAKTISTATDMYYDITALTDGVIVISNPGTEGIISITNIKFTFEEAASIKTVTTTSEDGTEEVSEASVASISEEGAVYSLRSLRAYSVSETVETEPEVTEPETTVPEETEPETTVPEETEPETTVPEETEPEETEPEETEPETTVPEETEPEYSETVEEVVKKVEEIIKKIFGWLFG